MLYLLLGWLLAAISPPAPPARPLVSAAKNAQRLKIGVFYFPGWFQSAWTPPKNWRPIQTIGDRTPTLGWYDPRSAAVMGQQLGWMQQYGIDYVVFDWTFSGGTEHVGAPIDAYLATKRSTVSFAILWANHDEPTTLADMRTITDIWLTRYMRSDRFLKVDGQPVVFIFSFRKLVEDARKNGSSASAYIQESQAMARRAGLPGIHFIGGTDDSSEPGLGRDAREAGLSAVSSYNLHRKPRAEQSRDPFWWKATHGYAALDQAYRAQWAAARSLPLPYVVPMTSGWDRRPWGGSDDPLHDRSIGSDAAFRAHLAAGRGAMTSLGRKSFGLGVICCWNEYGEGSFIEPTRQGGFGKLRQVQSVFGAHALPASRVTKVAR